MSCNESPSPTHRGRKLPLTIGLALAVAGLTAVTTGHAWADPSHNPDADTTALNWAVTSTPALDKNYSFKDVAAISDTDVWAVGHTVTQAWDGTVAAHWDGKTWESVPTPEGLSLNAVAGKNGDDVWAVGLSSSGNLTAHWDGEAWTNVDTPAPDVPGGRKPALYGVDTSHSGTAWAVGCASDESHTNQTPYAQVWDGSAWKLTEVPLPDGATSACLNSVEIISATEVWAVGRVADSDSGAPFTLMWNGEKWNRVEVPELDKPDAQLTGVISPAVGKQGGRMWAAGFTKDGLNDPLSGRPLLLEWDGTSWSRIETPQDNAWIYGLGANGSGGLLLAGYSPYGESVLLNFDGKTVTAANPPISDVSSLYGVTAIPDTGTVWAVGDAGDSKWQGMAAHSK